MSIYHLISFFTSLYTTTLPNNYGRLRRLLSFEPSDADINATTQPPSSSASPPPPANETTIPQISIVIEPGSGSSTPSPATAQEDFKRIGKLALPVALFLLGSSVALIVNAPTELQSRLHLVILKASICLSLVTGMGLSVYSIIRPAGDETARVQKKAMVIGIALICLAFFLRASFR